MGPRVAVLKLTRHLNESRTGPLCLTFLHAIALALFINGFLLTRVHLEQRSSANSGPPARSKLVWLMIDSMRYDFVVTDGRYSCAPGKICHQGRMAFLSNLTQQSEVARAFRFVADPPTTTTQRMKSLMTGGLPTFFDITSSFTAGRVTEDNLIEQLHAAGMRLVFLGDSTWAQLFPHQFHTSAAFPCFNIKDLHTVDNGIWERLLPTIRQPGSWNVLIAHYLGVDHAGHAHGVASKQMVAKLRQMDDHIRQVVEEMASRAGPGGDFEHALVLVSGDHGQTLTGDHGGGSPEEVDSAFVAIDPSALFRTSQQETSAAGVRGNDAPSISGRRLGSLGGLGTRQQPKHAAAAVGGLAGTAPCRATCSCGPNGNQCAADLPQIDLTPTLAALLGVPIPFGNLGKLSVELWGFAAAQGQQRGAGTRHEPSDAGAGLQEVLQANAEQVHKYLNAYAGIAESSFSQSALLGINTLYSDAAAPGHTSGANRISKYLIYLEAAARLASEQWTQFGNVSMMAGIALLTAALLLHAAAALGSISAQPAPVPGSSQPNPERSEAAAHHNLVFRILALLSKAGFVCRPAEGQWPVPSLKGALAALVMIHVLGIFSFFFLLSEGRNVCYTLGFMYTALGVSAAMAPRQLSAQPISSRSEGQGTSRSKAQSPASTPQQRSARVLLLTLLLLASNAAMAFCGLASHSGLGFWQRLTVHPDPASNAAESDASWVARLQTVLPGHEPWLPATSSLLCFLSVTCLAAVAVHMLGRHVQEQQQQDSLRPALRLQRLLTGSALVSVAAYHFQGQGMVQPNATAGQLLAQAAPWEHLAWLVPRQDSTLQAVWVAAKGLLRQLPLATGWTIAAAQLVMVHLLSQPLQLLLPRLTYTLCGAALVLWIVEQLAHNWLLGATATSFQGFSGQCHRSGSNTRLCHSRQSSGTSAALCSNPAAASASEEVARMAANAARLQGPLLAAVLQVSDSTTAAVLTLGWLQLWALRQLLHIRSQQLDSDRAAIGVEAALLLAVVQLQVFFTTGHLCEFAGLHHLAGDCVFIEDGR